MHELYTKAINIFIRTNALRFEKKNTKMGCNQILTEYFTAWPSFNV